MYYDKDVSKYISKNILEHKYFCDWYDIVREILLNDEFQRRKLFNHHKNKSVWDHSILVSFNSYLFARKFNLSVRRCAIAGLLHDFYPYAWLYNSDLAKLNDGEYVKRIGEKQKFFKKHGFVHGKEAAENVYKFFPELMDKRMYNSIKNHMFPLTLPPIYSEGIVVTLVDKYNSIKEIPSINTILKYMIKKEQR